MSDIPTIKEPARGNSTWGNWCVHYNGLQHKTCEAGVEYESVRTSVEYQLERRHSRGKPSLQSIAHPCFMAENPLAKPCTKCQFPTDAQIEEHDNEAQRYHDNLFLARHAIVKATNGLRGVAGKMICPVCKAATLNYSVASSNGHIHARCLSGTCVSWME